jgi:hypothetical protein
MASGDIRIIIDYANGDIKSATDEAEDKSKKAGKKSGKEYSKEFGKAVSRGFKSDVTPALKVITGATKTALALGAAVAGIGTVTLFKSVQAASEQEDAVNRLAGALKSSGEFSQEALTDFQQYASELQKISTVGDEVALGQLALAKSYKASNEQAKQIVTVASDMAQAFGTDLETQVRQISKTLGGFAGELGETQPALKALTAEQLRNGDAIKILGQAYAGQAQNALQTYSGAVAQAKNSFGDLLEQIGKIITQNPLLIKAIGSLNKLFIQTGEEVKKFGASFDIFKDVIFPLLDVGDTITNYVIPPLENFFNIGKVVFNFISAGLAKVISGFANLGFIVAKALDFAGVGEGVSSFLKDLEETTEKTADELSLKVGESLSQVYDFPISETLARKNEDLRAFFQEQRAIITEEGETTKAVANQKQAEAVDGFKTYGELVLGTFQAVEFGAKQSQAELAQVAKQTASIVKGGIANSISGGIQNIVQSLAKGEDVFANFGKFLLSTFGDLAIQLGSFFITQGIAVEALNAISGTGAIIAGTALVALGSIMKAFSGGGGSSSSGSAPSGATTPSFITGDTVEEGFAGEGEPAQAGTIVNVNVDGNVNDGGAFIRDLAEQIGEESDKQGIVFNNLATV